MIAEPSALEIYGATKAEMYLETGVNVKEVIP